MAANPYTKLIDFGCQSAENWQLPSTSTIAIVITTQLISWYSFYRRTRGRSEDWADLGTAVKVRSPCPMLYTAAAVARCDSNLGPLTTVRRANLHSASETNTYYSAKRSSQNLRTKRISRGTKYQYINYFPMQNARYMWRFCHSITVFHLMQRSPNVRLYSLDLSVFCMHGWVNVCFMLMANPLNLYI